MSTLPTDSARSVSLPRWLTPLAVALVVGLHGWLALSATAHKSTTVDEMAHLTAGHALWAKGDYRLQPENGVLPQLWEGIPAWFAHRRLPTSDHAGWTQPNVWTLGHVYFHQLGNDLGALLFEGRAMNLTWSIATGLLVFAWSRRLFGAAGAWVALLFWAFSPTFLAHGALATSDMCMTFFMLAGVGAYWRHLQDFRWRTGVLSAVVLALAFVAKYSAVLLPPMLLLLAAVRLLERRPMTFRGRTLEGKGARVLAILGSAAVHLLAAFVVIWAFHRFRFSPSPSPSWINDYTRPWAVVLSSLGGTTAQAVAWFRTHHVLPDAYLYGFAFVLDLSQERGAFLNGVTSVTGWVQFFPYAFLAKTTLALLLSLVVVAGVALRRWARMGRRAIGPDLYRVAPLLVLFVVYWAVSLTSHLNIGQRHLLPIYPVLFIATGALGWAGRGGRGLWPWATGALVAGHIAAGMLVRPHYLAFFNRLAGGPEEGYRHLVDSSLDWGQDLPGLADWLKARSLPDSTTPVYLAYFGTGDPEYYGIHATAMVPLLRRPAIPHWYRLEPGIYCISATLLSQAYSPIQGPWTPQLEKQYQQLHSVEAALLFYDTHPQNRADLERQTSAQKWQGMWQTYEQLTFKRLCYLLRARRPDAQIGYSINIYRLSADDIRAVTGPQSAWIQAVESPPPGRGSAESK